MPPKSKAAAPAALEDLFSALYRHIEAGDYSHAVKVADQGRALFLPSFPCASALTPV
jgi:hypothetical protein